MAGNGIEYEADMTLEEVANQFDSISIEELKILWDTYSLKGRHQIIKDFEEEVRSRSQQ